jgi:opacity protein-like surface antigen
MRSILRCCAAALFLVLLPVVPCAAQGAVFGLGARLSMIRTDAHSSASPERFTGGQMRVRTSPRTALELSMDIRTQRNDALTTRVRDVPVQASLLLFPATGAFSPYVLGGPGWYSHRVQTLAGDEVLDSETTRKFGWHGGFGAEFRLGRHAGVHADYRYTFLHFGSDEPSGVLSGALVTAPVAAPTKDESSGSRFIPSYDGSMWTAGLTVYF